MLDPFNDQYFMKQAYLEAQKAFDQDEVPVGAVIVCKNQIIARGHNLTEKLTDVTAHAEMIAITAAANCLGSKFLEDCTLYVTLEPCLMCASAIMWARVSRLVFGAYDAKAGYTLTQLIETSNICAHFVDESNSLFLNVHSCKDFDPVLCAPKLFWDQLHRHF